MKKEYATITLIGQDKAGVIARITQLLFQLGANIEAMEEQVSRRQFSMTLQASWANGKCDPARVRMSLQEAASDLGMESKVHFAPEGPQRFAILVTREEHVLKALVAATRGRKNALGALPAVVIGNRKDLAPLARKAGLPFCHIPFDDRIAAERKTLEILEEYGVDFLVLARFMKILSPNFVWRWKNKIINIHPSLLPAFPGANAYRQAYEKGVRVVGVTAHFVTPNLDEGPIIAQEAFAVKGDEPLPVIVKKGQALESKCVLRAVKAYVKRRLDVYWGRGYGS